MEKIKKVIPGIIGVIALMSLSYVAILSTDMMQNNILYTANPGIISANDAGLMDSPLPPGYDTPEPSPKGIGNGDWRGPVPE